MNKRTIHPYPMAYPMHIGEQRCCQDRGMHLHIFALLAASTHSKFEPAMHANSSCIFHAYDLYDAHFEGTVLPKFGLNQRAFNHILLLLISCCHNAFSLSHNMQVWSALSMLIVVAYCFSILQSWCMSSPFFLHFIVVWLGWTTLIDGLFLTSVTDIFSQMKTN